MKVLQRGFSLIELMIVIAIIGILAAIAIPSYKTYVIKSRTSVMMQYAEAKKNVVVEWLDNGGSLTPNCVIPGFPYQGSNPSTIHTDELGGIVSAVWFNPGGCFIEVDALTADLGIDSSYGTYVAYVLTPIPSSDASGYSWQCGIFYGSGTGAASAPRYFPDDCIMLN